MTNCFVRAFEWLFFSKAALLLVPGIAAAAACAATLSLPGPFSWMALGAFFFVFLAGVVGFRAIYHKRVREKRFIRDFKSRLVAITGCDSGFGYMLVQQLIEKEIHVVAGCLTENGTRSVKPSGVCEKFAKFVHPILLDITKEDSVMEFLAFAEETALKTNMKFHAVVNNAGIFCCGPAEWVSRETFSNVLNVNVTGTATVTTKAMPYMGTVKGRIVTISSCSALAPSEMMSTYSAAKAAVDAFIRGIAVEDRRGVHFSLITPSGFRTKMVTQDTISTILKKNFDSATEEVQNDFGTTYLETLRESWAKGVMQYSDEDLTLVTNDMLNAIYSEFPRDRYKPGTYTGLFTFASFLPMGAQRALMRFLHDAGRRRNKVKLVMAINEESKDNGPSEEPLLQE